MIDTPVPTEPTSPADTAHSAPAAPAAPGGLLPVEDDDLVIEDLSGAPWPSPTPRICICTVSAG